MSNLLKLLAIKSFRVIHQIQDGYTWFFAMSFSPSLLPILFRLYSRF